MRRLATANKASEGVAAEIQFREELAEIWSEKQARRFAIFIFISMLAYSAPDLILEPFAGAVFGMTPGETTKLAGFQHTGTMIGMVLVPVLHRLIPAWRTRTTPWIVGGCIACALGLLNIAAAAAVGPPWPIRASFLVMGITKPCYRWSRYVLLPVVPPAMVFLFLLWGIAGLMLALPLADSFSLVRKRVFVASPRRYPCWCCLRIPRGFRHLGAGADFPGWQYWFSNGCLARHTSALELVVVILVVALVALSRLGLITLDLRLPGMTWLAAFVIFSIAALLLGLARGDRFELAIVPSGPSSIL